MNHAVILAGGSGTRLWPLSNRETPKQLAPLFNGRCLLEVAMDRLQSLVPQNKRYICTSASWAAQIATLCPGLPTENLIGEPCGRDTLAALALSCFWILRNDPEANIAFLTSDHVITPDAKLVDCLHEAYRLLDENPSRCVTLGVVPDHPATGFGYLELGQEVGPRTPARRVTTFKEKPELALAETYLAAGPDKYVWNSGMFVWHARTFVNALHKVAPDIHGALCPILKIKSKQELEAFLEKVYPGVRKVSVDFGLMEPISRNEEVSIVALPLDAQWRDVGSWNSFAELLEKDALGNAVAPGSQAVLVECTGTTVISSTPGHVVVALGLEGYVVVRTPTATLIVPMKEAQRIKELHAQVTGLSGGTFA
jgi:mannose-1-phosphate guanylyltransferase